MDDSQGGGRCGSEYSVDGGGCGLVRQIDDNRRYVKTNHVSVREEGDENALLYDRSNGAVFLLNGSALRVWQAFTQPSTAQRVLSCLQNDYTIDESTNEAIKEAISFLIDQGLVKEDSND